jgi:hypothetical protein
MKWDISTIPSGSIVTGATLTTVNVVNSSSQVYEIYEMKRSWVEGQATWNAYATGQNWQTAGASGALDRGSTVLGTMAGGTGSQTFSLNAAGIALIQTWVDNGAANIGVIIQDYVNTNGFDFNSREDATPNQPSQSHCYLHTRGSGRRRVRNIRLSGWRFPRPFLHGHTRHVYFWRYADDQFWINEPIEIRWGFYVTEEIPAA